MPVACGLGDGLSLGISCRANQFCPAENFRMVSQRIQGLLNLVSVPRFDMSDTLLCLLLV